MIILIYEENPKEAPKAIIFNDRIEAAKYLAQNGTPPKSAAIDLKDVDASRISGWVKAEVS